MNGTDTQGLDDELHMQMTFFVQYSLVDGIVAL
jgi:hypothetical protein